MKKNGSKNGTGAQKLKRPGGGALLDALELARELGEHPRTIRTWRVAGVIPSLIIGRRTHRYQLSSVLSALEKRSV
jgi:hypothetical protein